MFIFLRAIYFKHGGHLARYDVETQSFNQTVIHPKLVGKWQVIRKPWAPHLMSLKIANLKSFLSPSVCLLTLVDDGHWTCVCSVYCVHMLTYTHSYLQAV